MKVSFPCRSGRWKGKISSDEIIKVRKGTIIIKDLRRLREMVFEEKRENLFPIMLPAKGRVKK